MPRVCRPPPPLCLRPQLANPDTTALYADGLPKDLGRSTIRGLQTKILEGTKRSDRYWTQVRLYCPCGTTMSATCTAPNP
jgi:hypothetical protein